MLRPGFVGMRGQWAYDYGMQDYEHTLCVNVFIILHIIAQPGPVILIFQYFKYGFTLWEISVSLSLYVCVCVFINVTVQPSPVIQIIQCYKYRFTL